MMISWVTLCMYLCLSTEDIEVWLARKLTETFNWKKQQKKGKLLLTCNGKEFNLLMSEGSYSPVLLKDQVSIFSHATSSWIERVSEAFLQIKVELFVKSIANILMLFLYYKTISTVL